jgi:uncharacterized membrane protein
MERKHEITRLEGFSDAVFAFALTLLVVSLEGPRSFDDLRNTMLGFLPFGLTFAMICWIWYLHQQFFRRYGLQDAWTITLNCFLLFVVLFYVYPLKFLTNSLLGPALGLAESGGRIGPNHGDVVLLLYSAGVVLVFGALGALYVHAWRLRAVMQLSPEELVELKSGLRGNGIVVALGAVSIAITLVAQAWDLERLIMVAGFIYILMGPLLAWNGSKTGRAMAALKKKSPATRS